MSSPVDIVIDAGQTGVRLGVAHAGRVIHRQEVAGMAYHGRQADNVLATLTAAQAAVLPPGRVDTVCLGLTSVLGDEGEYVTVAATLAERFEASRALVTGDVVTAHAGALQMRPGVVLAAGTGAIALGIGADGRSRQVDGWGYLFGDAGGGFWIGRRGLDVAMRGHDGRAPSGRLTTRAAAVFGDLAGLAERIYPTPDAVARVAGFAQEVLDLADPEPAASTRERTAPDARVVATGDESAQAIVAAAAAELAGTVVGACPPGDAPVLVSWTGRLLHHAGLRHRFLTELAHRCPRAQPAAPAGDGLTGAARLAAAHDLSHYADLIQVVTR